MSGVPKEIDETAYIDGYSFPKLLLQDFHSVDPLLASALQPFFCFMFSWVELLIARTLTVSFRQTDYRHYDTYGFRDRHGLGRAGGGGCT